MTFHEYYSFPVEYRRWLVDRLLKEIKQSSQQGSDIPTKGAHHNTPEIRQLAGRTKAFPPNAKLNRFT